jgi:3-keto-5-aminohexanoate cleavage enzyme
MEKLIITVTCDSTMSFPRNPHNPSPHGIGEVAKEYVRSVNAGAAICHLHGPYTVDEKVQADGTKLSDLDIPGSAIFRGLLICPTLGCLAVLPDLPAVPPLEWSN